MTAADSTPDKHLKLSLVLLIKEIFAQLDDVHAFKKTGHSGNLSMYLLTEMATVLKDLDAETQQMYFDILITLATAESNQPRKICTSETYATSSKSIKKLFIEKIRSQLLKTG